MKKLKAILAIFIVSISFVSFNNVKETIEVGLDEGNKAPCFNIRLLDGKPFNLQHLNGKMVMLNFWASYDAQSRINNYYLNDILKKYQEQLFINGNNLVVVSISLDRYKAPLDIAIEQDETQDFTHICDFMGTDGDISRLYNIDTPMNILIDGDGRIVCKDLNYSKIEESLSLLAAN